MNVRLTLYVECRWCPGVRVTRCVSSWGLQRWWRLSKVSNTNNVSAVQTRRRCNRQLWRNRRITGCQGDVVISKVVTWVKPSHDWRPVAAVRDATRHRDDVILLNGSRGWQVRCTAHVSIYTWKTHLHIYANLFYV